MSNTIVAKITDIGGGKVMLEIEGQPVILDAKDFPDVAIKSHKIKLYFLGGESALSEKKLAKTILEEILNGK